MSYSREIKHNVRERASTQGSHCTKSFGCSVGGSCAPSNTLFAAIRSYYHRFSCEEARPILTDHETRRSLKKKENWTKHRKYMQKEKNIKSLKCMNVKCRNSGRQTLMLGSLCTNASPAKPLPEVKYIKKLKEEALSILYTVTMK